MLFHNNSIWDHVNPKNLPDWTLVEDAISESRQAHLPFRQLLQEIPDPEAGCPGCNRWVATRHGSSWHGRCRSQLGECSGTWLLGVPVVCVMGFLIRSNCFSLELPSPGNCHGFKLGTVWPSTHGQNNPGGILSAFPQLKRLQGATQAGVGSFSPIVWIIPRELCFNRIYT